MGSRALFGAALLILSSMPVATRAEGFDDAVLAEINFARADPSDYARELRRAARLDPDAPSLTPDDPGALAEAIDFLEDQKPLEPLSRDERLAASAIAHVEVQGAGGGVGHDEPSGMDLGTRLHRHGVWASLAGEDISYGYATAREVVRQLIIDSGVPNRGHRQNIFDPAYQYAGVGCGRHSIYRSMCVIDFAGMLVKR